jgi:hypothetical protein
VTAPASAFLDAGDGVGAARFITGVELPVDGGTSTAAGPFRFDPSP